jgi:serine/threonine-protein kinase Chk2
MLIVDPEKRYTIDQCLSHPWMTANMPGINDSTDGLVGSLAGLEVGRRGVTRERTLLSSINTVHITNRVPMGENQPDLKIYSKHPKNTNPGARKEVGPADNRPVGEFVRMGGRGDQELFGNDDASNYSKADISTAKTKGKGKGKANGR